MESEGEGAPDRAKVWAKVWRQESKQSPTEGTEMGGGGREVVYREAGDESRGPENLGIRNPENQTTLRAGPGSWSQIQEPLTKKQMTAVCSSREI